MTNTKPSVLYVEDNEILQLLMKNALSTCDVTPALTGEAALDILEEHPKFDLILVDINLGAGINGIEVCRLIRSREQYKVTPVVALTAMDYASIGEHIHPDMFNEYVAKPFKLADILRLGNKYLTTESS